MMEEASVMLNFKVLNMPWFIFVLLIFVLFTDHQCQCAVDVQFSHKIESDTGHDLFGTSLATSHHKLVIGAPDDFNHKGAITVNQRTKITPFSGNSFGYYTDVNKDFIIASNFNPNSVMIFEGSVPYTQKANIPVASNIMAVDIAEDCHTITISLAAYQNCQLEVYEYDGSSSWHLSQRIKLKDCYAAPMSRMPVSVSRNVLVVGVPDGKSGHVVIYKKQGRKWVIQQTLQAPLSATEFGRSIAMQGNQLVVASGRRAPCLFTYNRDTNTGKWINRGKLIPPGSYHEPLVAIDRDILVVTVTDRRQFPEVCGVAYKISSNDTTKSAEPFATLKTSDKPLGEAGSHISVSVQEGKVYTARVFETGLVFVHDLTKVPLGMMREVHDSKRTPILVKKHVDM